jgi:hypothetical protein
LRSSLKFLLTIYTPNNKKVLFSSFPRIQEQQAVASRLQALVSRLSERGSTESPPEPKARIPQAAQPKANHSSKKGRNRKGQNQAHGAAATKAKDALPASVSLAALVEQMESGVASVLAMVESAEGQHRELEQQLKSRGKDCR